MSAARFQPRSPPGRTPSAPVRFVTSSEHRATTLTQARKSRPARLRPGAHQKSQLPFPYAFSVGRDPDTRCSGSRI